MAAIQSQMTSLYEKKEIIDLLSKGINVTVNC